MTVGARFFWENGLVPLAAGVGLGLAYFAGLWWTSRRVAQVRWPGPFFVVSFALRLALLLGGVWLVAGGRLMATGMCLAGILIGRRLVLARVVGRPEQAG
ncbi:MAG: ATP synthase subunit I [Firmicutes bacterium]|nr:ATP synthase subunit I [Bacillota bacterium]